MIGSTFKKYAKEHNMTISHGIAYGNLKGFTSTLSEGAGYKLVQISTTFVDPQSLFHLETILNGINLMKEYRVQNIQFSPQTIQIVFYDNPGTMKKIVAFVDWFYPLLEEHNATKHGICIECGDEITSGKWLMIDGMAFYFHDTCARTVQQTLFQQDETRKFEDTGNYLSGFVGALLGSFAGSVLWALVLLLGYMASIVGFFMGWLANKGYDLLHGKQGKGKVFILLISVILGVFVGNILGETFTLISMIQNGELYGWAYSDIPTLWSILLADAEFIRTILINIGVGLFFASLGIISILIRAKKETSDTKIIEL